MAGKQSVQKKRSKRALRTKIIVYFMVALMVISAITAGLAAFV
ncbi:DUF4044 domain-containing protein [Oceanobacillus locisalsi]|uniref:DUF4044 domain-containing protein n=1 Tax=Oceanobacillus locisalsi TaxID=546107 RepID=A0ABW3NF81_9BACI